MRKLALIFVAVLLSSCAPQTLYNWKGYDEAIYKYTKVGDEESLLDLIEFYEEIIEDPEGTRHTPPPGVCADLGYLLLKKGEIAKGKDLLKKEILLYPESKPFIDKILKRFEK